MIYLMLHMPTIIMQTMIKMMIAMPLPVRESLFIFMMQQMFNTTDDELQKIMRSF